VKAALFAVPGLKMLQIAPPKPGAKHFGFGPATHVERCEAYCAKLVFCPDDARRNSAASRSACALCAVARTRMSGGSTAVP
jgi:hypothetical protein